MQTEQEKLGWFTTKGRLGDRTLDQQLLGLDWLLANCQGKRILDLGCAEGLISMELARRGAMSVRGIEIIQNHLYVAKKLMGDLPVKFKRADLNVWRPNSKYDIVIALALLHKLRDPSSACADFAAAATEAVVLRMPPTHAPDIIDERSDFEIHTIGDVMVNAGFYLHEYNYDGPFNEWVGVWLRKPQGE